MSNQICVQRMASFGKAEWRAVRSNGDLLFEIRLQRSLMLHRSHYFVIDPRGEVVRYGTFNYDTWDTPEIVQILTAIVTAIVPGAEVDVELDAPRPASGV